MENIIQFAYFNHVSDLPESQEDIEWGDFLYYKEEEIAAKQIKNILSQFEEASNVKMLLVADECILTAVLSDFTVHLYRLVQCAEVH